MDISELTVLQFGDGDYGPFTEIRIFDNDPDGRDITANMATEEDADKIVELFSFYGAKTYSKKPLTRKVK